MSELKDIYEANIKKKDITAGTYKLIDKANPKSPLTLAYNQELFGITPDVMKKLPLKAVEAFQQALRHLIGRAMEDPVLRQGLKRLITAEVAHEMKAEEQAEETPMKEEKETESYVEFLAQLSEATKATKFNYTKLLDIDDKKIMDPAFISLLTTFGLVDSLSRMQKQGVLIFLKKLAELASSNPQIAQALTKLVRIENAVATEVPPVQESKKEVKDVVKESSLMDAAMIVEGLINSEISPTTLLADFGIGNADQAKKDALAGLIFSYDKNFLNKNQGKKITWKAIEAAFNHSTKYLPQLFKFITSNQTRKGDFVQKVADLTKKQKEILDKVIG